MMFLKVQLKTNNYGFINGTNGNRKIEIPKPKNLILINQNQTIFLNIVALYCSMDL